MQATVVSIESLGRPRPSPSVVVYDTRAHLLVDGAARTLDYDSLSGLELTVDGAIALWCTGMVCRKVERGGGCGETVPQ